jgi:hypothetical protein
MNISNIDLAYAAGYIDGDGCFFTGLIGKRPKFVGNLIIVSTNEQICPWFQKLFSAGCLSSQDNISKQCHRTMYSLRMNKTKALPIVKTLFPKLIEKKNDAQSFINFCESKSNVEKIELIQKMRSDRKNNDLIYPNLKEEYESQRDTISPTAEDYAYLSGFIDAEGCFTISRYKPKNKPNYFHKAILELNNSKAAVFLWILQRFGGVIHFKNLKSKYGDKHRDQFIWIISAKNLGELLPKIYPYLKQKKQLCQQLINFQKTIVPMKGLPSRKSEDFQRYFQSILEIREKIYNNVKDLNKKGRTNI